MRAAPGTRSPGSRAGTWPAVAPARTSYGRPREGPTAGRGRQGQARRRQGEGQPDRRQGPRYCVGRTDREKSCFELPGRRAGPVALAEGALELGRQQAVLAVARRRVEPQPQVGVDPLRPSLDRADQIAGARSASAPGSRRRCGVQLGRGGDHLLADRGQLTSLLLGGEAVGDRRLPSSRTSAGPRAAPSIGVAAGQAGSRRLFVFTRRAAGGRSAAQAASSAVSPIAARGTPRSTIRPPRPIT